MKIFALEVECGNMTYERSEEMLSKIDKIATNDLQLHENVNDYANIKVSTNNREIIVDLMVHLIVHHYEDPGAMNVTYATCKSVIKNASREQLERTCKLMHDLIKNSTNGLRMPYNEEMLVSIQQRLSEEGLEQLLILMPNFE